MGSEAFDAALKDLKAKHPEWEVPVPEEVEEGAERIVCHCFSVTEGEIRKVIRENHLTTVEQVTHFTKAGGGCGGCRDDIQAILDDMNGQQARAEETTAPAPSNLTNLQRIALIQSVMDTVIRPGLKADGGDVELIDIDGNDVKVRLKGKCAGCGAALQTLKHWVEAKLREKVSGGINVIEVK